MFTHTLYKILFAKETTFIKTSQQVAVVVYITIHFSMVVTNGYHSLKTIDNLNTKFSKHSILKIGYIHANIFKWFDRSGSLL